MRRLSPGDWLIYYSPRERMGAGARIQAFTAIGRLREGDVVRVRQGENFHPFRRDMAYVPSRDAPIAPMLDRLGFTAGRKNWGLVLRRGLMEIRAEDGYRIARAMAADLGDAAP